MQQPGESNEYQWAHARVLCASFRHWTGEPLLGPEVPAEGLGQALYRAPFCVVSHRGGADPVFDYANERALEVFGYDWESFTRLPSRLSAGPEDRAERQALLEEVARRGFSRGYRGVRVRADGARFVIDDALVWNLLGPAGGRIGQAAAFWQWAAV